MHRRMMQLLGVHIAIFLLLLPHVTVEGNSIPKVVQQNVTDGSAPSPWLKKVMNNPPRRDPGCWNKPWICGQKGEFPPSMWCCRNLCVNVTSDINNCGLCGFRCPFTWQCCRGQCINTNLSPLNCGRCENRCPFGVRCQYGMCGYAEPRPPFPFPPKPPRPPFPFPPKPPKPPRPPFPFPPKPPRPPFPFPPKPPKPPKGWQPPAME